MNAIGKARKSAGIVALLMCMYYLFALFYAFLYAMQYGLFDFAYVIDELSEWILRLTASLLAAFAFFGYGERCLSAASSFACCTALLIFLRRFGELGGDIVFDLFTLGWLAMAVSYGVFAFDCVAARKGRATAVICCGAVFFVRTAIFVYKVTGSGVSSALQLFELVFPFLAAVIAAIYAVGMRKGIKKAFPGKGTLDSIEDDLIIADSASMRADVLDRL